MSLISRTTALIRSAAALNSLTLGIVEVGDEARMPYGTDAEARLVREDGAWKIEDPD